jgi:serine/threonine-protein kinase
VSPSLIGAAVGNYRIVDVLGEGGMGTVYRAIHPELERTVAIKVLALGLAESDDIVRRFRVEARAVNRIKHPNVVDVQDFGMLPDGRPYYVMEFLAGESLSSYLGRVGVVSPRDCLLITLPVTEALAAAHTAGVVHRDLKPDNIFLVARPGASPTPKLLDFGIAKVLSETIAGADQSRTRSGSLMGTPQYMSPEQAAGRVEDIGTPSDVYSLGVIVYQMLAGKPPFESEAFGELLMMHMQREPQPLSSRAAGVPPRLDQLVMRMLAKAPSARPANATLLRGELQAIADELALAASGPLAQSPLAPTLAAPVHESPRTTALPSGVAGEVGRRTAPPSPGHKRFLLAAAATVGAAAIAIGVVVARSSNDSKPDVPAAPAPIMDAARPTPMAPDAAPIDAAIADAGVDAALTDIEWRLQILKEQYDSGKISKQEYDARRKQILDRFTQHN